MALNLLMIVEQFVIYSTSLEQLRLNESSNVTFYSYLQLTCNITLKICNFSIISPKLKMPPPTSNK